MPDWLLRCAAWNSLVRLTLVLKVTIFNVSELLVLNLEIEHLQLVQATDVMTLDSVAYRLPLSRKFVSLPPTLPPFTHASSFYLVNKFCIKRSSGGENVHSLLMLYCTTCLCLRPLDLHTF